jgi:hypothetical protein
MQKFCFESIPNSCVFNEQQYELAAVVMHMGPNDSGHYYTYSVHPNCADYVIEHNDKKVTAVPDSVVASYLRPSAEDIQTRHFLRSKSITPAIIFFVRSDVAVSTLRQFQLPIIRTPSQQPPLHSSTHDSQSPVITTTRKTGSATITRTYPSPKRRCLRPTTKKQRKAKRRNPRVNTGRHTRDVRFFFSSIAGY